MSLKVLNQETENLFHKGIHSKMELNEPDVKKCETAVWVTPFVFLSTVSRTITQLGFEILCQSCSLKPAFPKSEVYYKYTLLPFTTLTVESHFN